MPELPGGTATLPPHNLPVQPSPLLGCEEVIDEDGRPVPFLWMVVRKPTSGCGAKWLSL